MRELGGCAIHACVCYLSADARKAGLDVGVLTLLYTLVYRLDSSEPRYKNGYSFATPHRREHTVVGT